ncbi:MAG: hypothetical protein NC209_08275 [Alistipes sp.]|nr:hypothetical protein [Alistipes senegalensis]MCM1251118.1 hypothetical protein [Alistipes sp.]
MKTAFYNTAFLLLTFGSVAVVSTASAHEEKDSKERENHTIVIRKDLPNPALPTCPRMPARAAIDCMYETAGESLVFDFFDDLGGVTITVTNTTTGETFFDFCSDTPGTCRTALSGDCGSYRIELEDDGGRTYTGTFEL